MPKRKDRRRLWLAAMTLLALCGCAGPGGAPFGHAAVAAETSAASLNTPQWVLDGTDLLEMGDVERAALANDPSGEYAVEQGGSVLRLDIRAESAERWSVERAYSEPGVTPRSARYQVRRDGDALVSADGNVVVQGTKMGVLVLELDSGESSIPPDYWVHYLR